jgi:hypothetical protein
MLTAESGTFGTSSYVRDFGRHWGKPGVIGGLIVCWFVAYSTVLPVRLPRHQIEAMTSDASPSNKDAITYLAALLNQSFGGLDTFSQFLARLNQPLKRLSLLRIAMAQPFQRFNAFH